MKRKAILTLGLSGAVLGIAAGPGWATQASYSDLILADNPVAFWGFEEAPGATTAADGSGNGHDGSYVAAGGSLTLGQPSASTRLGSAMTVSGGGHVEIAADPAFQVGGGDFTVGLWYKTASSSRGDLFNDKDAGSDFGMMSNLQAAPSAGSYHSGNSFGPGYAALNTWHYLTVSRKGGVETLYLDGQTVQSKSVSSALATTAALIIGANHDVTTNAITSPFNGSIDNVAFYNKALSANTIRTQYLTGLGTPTIGINFVGGGAALSDTDSAGHPVIEQAHWNNLSGATGASGALVNSAGQATGTTVTWNAPGVGSVAANSGSSGSSRMMSGYLDSGSTGQTSVTVSGIGFSSYDVYVYFDGENGGSWASAKFTLNGTSVLSGEDSEGKSFDTDSSVGTSVPAPGTPGGFFQLPVSGGSGNSGYATLLDYDATVSNNNEGNFVVFHNVTGDSFTLLAEALGGSNNATKRAPINGIQIIGTTVPAPAALPAGLALLGGFLGLSRRRR